MSITLLVYEMSAIVQRATHLEPDILECEVKRALESTTMNKASGGDGIPVELFQILKDDAVKVLHSICPTSRFWGVGDVAPKSEAHCVPRLQPRQEHSPLNLTYTW